MSPSARSSFTSHLHAVRRLLPTLAPLVLVMAHLSSGFAEPSGSINADGFEHQFIETELPERGWGYGVSALGDFDDDGDLDYTSAVRGDNVYWFENQGENRWTRHVAGELPIRQLGSTVMDVDRDGLPDIVIGGYWYRNTGSPREEPFELYQYDDRIKEEVHDIVPADVTGDGEKEPVVLSDSHGSFWYGIPDNPARDANWQRHTITLDVLDENDDIHAGFFPQGIGDLNGDGDNDVVMPDRWYENRDGGETWVRHSLPWGSRGPWGLSARSWVLDLNGNGRMDIVIVDCDQPGSRAAWLENEGGDPPQFEAHELKQSAEGTRGSFHSLAVADFNGSGLMDIFVVEQEDTSIFPEGATPRWYIWENVGDTRSPQFEERVIFDGRLGGHDAVIGDVNGNGKTDIVSKIWSVWDDNANDGRPHIDLMKNVIDEE